MTNTNLKNKLDLLGDFQIIETVAGENVAIDVYAINDNLKIQIWKENGSENIRQFLIYRTGYSRDTFTSGIKFLKTLKSYMVAL